MSITVTDKNYEEKRSFVRMRIDTMVAFTIKGKSDQTYHGTSQNLSASGLYMTTEKSLEVGDEVELIMNSNSQRLPPFVAEGKVVRCITDDAEAALYNVSIKLSNTQ